MSSFSTSNSNKYYEVDQSPLDTPSDISFSSNHDLIAVSSWDNSVYFYNYESLPFNLKSKISLQNPILCTAFMENLCLAGSSDGTLQIINLQTGGSTPMKFHDNCIRHVKAITPHVFMTGSWDKTIKIMDIRSQGQPTVINVPERVYTLDVHSDFFACTTAGNRVITFDYKNPNPTSISTKLTYQITSLSIIDHESLLLSSVDGKGEYINLASNEKKYVFKTHRTSNEIFSVNVVKSQPNHLDIFTTGGNDGYINFFNKSTRQKLATNDMKIPVNTLAFSKDGATLAVGLGYDWSKGFEVNDIKPEIKICKLKNPIALKY